MLMTEDIDFPVTKTVYLHDEYADRDICNELYGEHRPRVGYEVKLEVKYYEDQTFEIVGCENLVG